jgi:hypothetical protein
MIELSVDDLLALPASGQEVTIPQGVGLLDLIQAGTLQVEGDLLVADPGDFRLGEFESVGLRDGSHDVAFGVVRVEGRVPIIATVVVGNAGAASSWRAADLPLMVDAGAGALMSRHVVEGAGRALVDDQRWNAVVDVLLERGYTRAAGHPDSCLVFTCALGDDSYPIYVGTDDSGAAVAVLIDLFILEGAAISGS